ncbi:MAG: gamma-glutamylcyclotransferase family protein [Planctomycetaceae bacterium]
MSQSERIFVYGSLKRGCELAVELQDQEFLRTAITQPVYRMFDCGSYPGLIRVARDGIAVNGELYSVSQSCLKRLDRVEGVDEGMYERRRIELQAPDDSCPAWAWFYLRPVAGLRDCGRSWPCP